MNTDEILHNLTMVQRKELEEKLHIVAAAATVNYNKDPEKFGRITQTIKLRDNISLQVTVSLHEGDKGKIHPVMEEVAYTASNTAT